MKRKYKSRLKDDEVLTTQELAKRWKLTPECLEQWRRQGKGPPFIRLTDGERSPVVYKVIDIIEYEKERTT
jgi:hypothetical protein